MTKEGILQLKKHEGLNLQAYRCPAGVLTIGYGHTVGVKDGDTITLQQADEYLQDDIIDAERGARELLDNFLTLSPVRQDAVVNLVFNLGKAGLSKFKNFLREMRAGQFHAAAQSLIDSKWYDQVGLRSKDIVQMIQEG
jgi:lysozyme